MRELVVSTPSQIRSKSTSRRIMLDVLIALVPAAVAGTVFFGFYSLAVMAISVASAIATEFVYLFALERGWRGFRAYVRNFALQFDFTSVITGLMLALILPPDCAWYLPFLGSIFAVAAVKMLFGGTGKNIVNPAITGRVFLVMSFAAASEYVAPAFGAIASGGIGILASPTPLTSMLAGAETISILDMFFGTGVAGCIGETCKLAILAGGVYLIARRVIKWWWPCIYIGATGLFASVFGGFDFSLFLPSVLSGGLIFGAVFMATDYSTSPKSQMGNVIYYMSLGVLTAGLRVATGIEVVSYCIMLMNIVVPFIDTYIVRKPFGYKRRKETIS